MSRQAFYDRVAETLFKGSLPDWQKRPLDLLIDEGLKRNRLLTETAYVLATAYHETARFKYMEEIGRGEGRDYGEPILLIRGKTVTYHGRGFVQLTWLVNYLRMERKLGLKIVDNPDAVMDPEIANQIIWEGMIAGDFTGKNLADYISDTNTDYVEARRIVNGTDKAEMIAGYAREFETSLRLIDDPKPEVTPCPLGNRNCPLTA
jgi:hypothetical protein